MERPPDTPRIEEERSVPVNFSAFRLRELCLALDKNRVKNPLEKQSLCLFTFFFFLAAQTDTQ